MERKQKPKTKNFFMPSQLREKNQQFFRSLGIPLLITLYDEQNTKSYEKHICVIYQFVEMSYLAVQFLLLRCRDASSDLVYTMQLFQL